MSKMKRKWLRVIEWEETGTPLDESTRAQLVETHPNLPALLHQQPLSAEQIQQLEQMIPHYAAVEQDNDDIVATAAAAMSVTAAAAAASPPLRSEAFAAAEQPLIDTRLEQQIQTEILAVGSDANTVGQQLDPEQLL